MVVSKCAWWRHFVIVFVIIAPLRGTQASKYQLSTNNTLFCFFVSACKAILCYAPFYTQLTFFYLTSQDFFLLTFNDDVVLLLLA